MLLPLHFKFAEPAPSDPLVEHPDRRGVWVRQLQLDDWAGCGCMVDF